MPRIHDSNGKFKRSFRFWTPQNWDEGYFETRGYFRVFRPDYPGAYKDGSAKRSHIVYWLNTGHVIRKGEIIHHHNENTHDDCFSNLQLMKRDDHMAHHRGERSQKLRLIISCHGCGIPFSTTAKQGLKFHSPGCYREYRKSEESRIKHSELMREKAQRGELRNYEREKTHCPSGHPYDAANTRLSKKGSRLCRICHRARVKARKIRLRQARMVPQIHRLLNQEEAI